mgnify:CR=1 FL=1
MNVNTFDVIVVGASNAGGFATAAAAENGAKVLCIDKMSNADHLYRNTLGSINSNSQKRAGVNIDKNKIVQYLTAFTQDNVDQRLLWAWANHSGETMNWLEEKVLKPQGIHLYSYTDAYYETLINMAFPTANEITRDNKSWARGWGKYVIDYDQKLGAEFKWNTKLEHLLTDNKGRVIGVEVKDRKTNEISHIHATKGVVLATGGYGANTALIQKWNPTLLKKCVATKSPRDDGSGQIAAMEVGAARDDEGASIIFDRGAVAPGTNIKDTYYIGWDAKMLTLGSFPFLKVNLKGKRFFNESAPYQFEMNANMHQPGNLDIAIFNKNTMNHLKDFHTLGCSRVGWPGGNDMASFKKKLQENLDRGIAVKANTIEELAEKLCIPKETLVSTVKRYNEMVHKGVDTEFGKEKYRLFPVEGAPYYGITFGGVLLATFDGLHINDHMEVLNENYNPIKGLYAAGNCSGGFFWGSYEDRLPGLAAGHATTFGRLAGKYVVKEN